MTQRSARAYLGLTLVLVTCTPAESGPEETQTHGEALLSIS